MELYDSARAKIDANFRWLFAKAYGTDDIPEDLQDPFYVDQYEQEHIKPRVIRLLLSGELYCRVCGLILKGEQAASLHSHQSVIQALSRKGIYVLESDNTPVSDRDLSSTPIKMTSHIPLIDALMVAYTVEMISIEKVVSSVKRFSNFSASKDLPFNLEDAMVFWINKVNIKMREISDKELKMKQHLLDSPGHQKPDIMHALAHCLLEPVEFSRVVRYRRDHLSGRTLQHFPLLDDLMKDLSDGTALLAVMHFYCPEVMRLEDICLKEVPSIADSVYNIHLLSEFSNEYLNKSFYLRTEDMLYSPPVLKNNLMVFIAELFWWFEIVKPDFVQPRDLQEIKDVRSLLQPKSSRPHVPISNATKRSFLTTSCSADILTTPPSPDLSNKLNPSSGPSHSLLPLRQRQQKMQEDCTSGLRNRANSLTRVDGQPQGSILAWPEKRQRPLSQPVPFALHFPLEGDGDSVSLARSISKDSLASNIMSITPKHILGSGPQLPLRRFNGQGLLGHIRIEDEEEEVEEEELIAIIHPAALARHRLDSDMEQDELEIQNGASVSAASSARRSPRLNLRLSPRASDPQPQADSFYLEPLMPAIPKQAKEKSISLNKQEESGESRFRAVGGGRKANTSGPNTTQRRSPVARSKDQKSFIPTPVDPATSPFRPPIEGAVGTSQSDTEESKGFFLHMSGEPEEKVQAGHPGQVNHGPFYTAWEVSHDSDSEIADLEEEEEGEEEQMELTKEVLVKMRGKCLEEGRMSELGEGEGESAKLREDMKVTERDDKEGSSGRSSPCLSTMSWASSCSASVSNRMTSMAERKLHKRNLHDSCSSTSSSQKTTPDGSEIAPYPLGGSWRLKNEGGPSWLGKDGVVGPPVVPSELIQLHMKLQEQQRAIEHQRKNIETLSARQRMKLGKSAFLNIVKKGGGKSDTLPQPLKWPRETPELSAADGGKMKIQLCKDDSFLEALRGKGKAGQTTGGKLDRDNRLNTSTISPDEAVEPDLSECSRSIELLNKAISSIQQQMMQLSLQQDMLMKQSVVSPSAPPESGSTTTPVPTQTLPQTSDPSPFPVVHFVDFSGNNSAPARRPPKLSSAKRSSQTKPSELKQGQEKSRPVSTKHNTQPPDKPSPRESTDEDQEEAGFVEHSKLLERKSLRNTTFRVCDDPKQHSLREGPGRSTDVPLPQDPVILSTSMPPSGAAETDVNKLSGSGKEAVVGEEGNGVKTQLIEVDLSDLKNPSEEGGADITDSSADGEQKNVLGFFFKDEVKAEDEMAKRRAAFLLKQQRKAEEARLRKQQQEVESEVKRDETRRKAEEERVRKEEEKARRELIKQEYLQRKQQELMEEQGLVKPRPRTKSRKCRPKSLHREQSNTLSKGSITRQSLKVSMLIKAQGSAAGCRGADLSCSHRGSTLSLATEAGSVTSGGAESQRAGSVCSAESFPLLSRASSRTMERDWENCSTASSITSTAEYNGPKLFKEPSSKSNKSIIINAITHCCLPGKVNESQKNVLLEELDKCESNHLLILFRDGGCQFRAIYTYIPDTEEIIKFTGTGPRTISQKMIDKLYKYSSDRKQFTNIPAKTVSASMDALTIHNYLWQVKRPGSARRK
ncbi:calmodulin-regulated spectrin-associated protein 1a [Polymixia lowei]